MSDMFQSATGVMTALMAVLGMYAFTHGIADLRAGKTYWGATGLILAVTVAFFFFVPVPWATPHVDIDHGVKGQ
ncbi:MAG: hypothetical protein HC869_25765 [Rhodospirillales bacterium]|nr:hypothetical protein [Rhodospirillales bacterium]